MITDPLLQSEEFLRLAAYRRQQRRQRQRPDWRYIDGLSARLMEAKTLPQHDPWDLPGVYEGAPGFGGLLWEARQAQEEHHHAT